MSQKKSGSRKSGAMLLWLLARYRTIGEEVSEFATEKLSYFLQRFGEQQLRLSIEKGYYGPYSGKVRHVLYALNGKYLRGFEQKDSKPFEPLELIVSRLPEVDAYPEQHLSDQKKDRLQKIAMCMQGFEPPYVLELLASVDFVLQQNHVRDARAVSHALAGWSPRKSTMFSLDHVELAIKHLESHQLN